MGRVMGFLIFISVFSGICLAGNYYILSRLFSFFHLKQHVVFWIAVVILAFSYIGASVFDRMMPCMLSHMLVKAAALWLGVAWICLMILLTHDVLYLIFRFPISVSRWFAIGSIALLSLYSFLNACRIDVQTIRLKAPVDMKLVQLSDVHLGSVGQGHLERLIRKTNALDPDVVLITGDLVDPAGHLEADSLECLNQLNASTYWVTGNHERYAGLEKVTAMLKGTGVTALRNEVAEFAGVQIIGIDDSDDRSQVQNILPTITYDPTAFNILMYHQPEGFDYASVNGVDLMLCGHTHNGQIFPFNAFVRMRFKHILGLYEQQGAYLYVSPGSGTWGPPMRLGSRNQITLIQLHTTN